MRPPSWISSSFARRRWHTRGRRDEELRRFFANGLHNDLGPGDPLQRANDAALALCVPRSPERGVAIDVGCGAGRHEVLLRARGWERAFGFDLVPQLLARAQGYTGVAVAELHHLPVRPVELVLCSQVLAHVPRLEPALDALVKLVRYRGNLVLSLPHPRAVEAGLSADPRRGRQRPLPIAEVVAAVQRRGLAVQLVTEPAPEPPLAREQTPARVPLVYALCARRVAG